MRGRKGTKTAASSLLQGHRRAIAGLVASSFAGGLVEAVFLVVITRAAFAITAGDDEIVIPGGRSLSIGNMVWLALVLVIVRLGLSLLSSWQSSYLSNKVMADVRRDLASAFLRSSWEVQQAQRAGRLQELLTTFAGNAAALVGSVTGIVVSVFSLIAMIGLAIIVDPVGSVVVVVAVSVLALALRPVRSLVRRQSGEAAQVGMQFATSLNEVSKLGMEVHVFNVQPRAEADVQKLIEATARVGERLGFVRSMIPNLYAGLAYLALVGAIAFVAVSDTTSFTSLGAVMLVMMRSLSYGQGLQVAVTGVSSAAPFVESLQDQLALYRSAEVVDHGVAIGRVGTLCLDHVSFQYVPDQPVLSDVTAAIPACEIVGIIGPSGSGKSTLVQLLLGLRPPTSGRVTADGRDIRELSHSEWARKVTFVPQSSHLIAGSIADNIRFMRDGVDGAAIERASRLAQLHEDVMGWPDGYDRGVGEDGGHLSGGQQQRLCIARALVEDPDVLILDEPTSSLDVRSESLIRDTLAELGRRMTVIVIAHRMSTLEICTRIMVIQDGQLKAFDTPEQLERTSDFYREALVLSGLRQ